MVFPERTIDLNADLGEGCPWDEALLERVSSASVSCGAHAGDPDSIRRTLALAKARGVVVGAHPGYPDREHFGRTEQNLSPLEVNRLVRDQLADLDSLAAEVGIAIEYIKPHGALYNQAQWDLKIACGILNAAKDRGLPVLGQPGSLFERTAETFQVPFVPEGFADRRYRTVGRLVPRTEPGAILDDPAEIAAQVLRLIDQGIATLCLHGDNPHSVPLADLVLETLRTAGIAVRSFQGPGH